MRQRHPSPSIVTDQKPDHDPFALRHTSGLKRLASLLRSPKLQRALLYAWWAFLCALSVYSIVTGSGGGGG